MKRMRISKILGLFSLGGGLYCGIELLWRRRTHGSMFLLGGLCFVLLGELGRFRSRLNLPVRAMLCGGIITALELLCGLAVNRKYTVWDYRDVPLNFKGQICLPYAAAWMPLGLVAMWLYGKLGGLPAK